MSSLSVSSYKFHHACWLELFHHPCTIEFISLNNVTLISSGLLASLSNITLTFVYATVSDKTSLTAYLQ